MNHRKYLLFNQRAVTLKNCILPTAQPLLCTMSHRFDKALPTDSLPLDAAKHWKQKIMHYYVFIYIYTERKLSQTLSTSQRIHFVWT